MTSIKQLYNYRLHKRQLHVIVYAVLLAVLLFVLKWMHLRFMIIDHAVEIYVGLIALFFTGLGVWLASKLATPRPATIIIEKAVPSVASKAFDLNTTMVHQLGISKREMEVLTLMAAGLSNNEIAARLFLSVSTIKTHSSNLFFKLEVERRTQAVLKAKTLGLVP